MFFGGPLETTDVFRSTSYVKKELRLFYALDRKLFSKVGHFKSEYGPDTLSKRLEISIKTHNYTRPGSYIKTALPQAP